MPIKYNYLDSFNKKEDATLLFGRNVILKIIEDPHKTLILSNPKVKKLISKKNLYTKEIVDLMNELIIKESQVYSLARPEFEKLIELGETIEKIQDDLKYLTTFPKKILELLPIDFEKIIEKTLEKTLEQDFKKLEKKFKKPEEAEKFKQGLIKIVVGDRKNEIEEANRILLSTGKKLKERLKLEILSPSVLLFCPNCNYLLSEGEYSGEKECSICKIKISREDAERILVNRVLQEIKHVWNSGLWFEAYIAKILRRLKWKTWVGTHVIGYSGVRHEIDILAINRDEKILVVECKIGKISRRDVFNFFTKVYDLKAHQGILCLIDRLPDPETKKFLNNTPLIVTSENITNIQEEQIVNFLKVI